MPADPLLHEIPCLPPDVDGFEVSCIRGKLSIDGQGHLLHETCNGTGYRFPMLGRDCPCAINCGKCGMCMDSRMDHSVYCMTPGCNGTGRIGVYTVEALLQAASNYPLFVLTFINGDPRPYSVMIDRGEWHDGITPEEALKAVLLAAVKEETDAVH